MRGSSRSIRTTSGLRTRALPTACSAVQHSQILTSTRHAASCESPTVWLGKIWPPATSRRTGSCRLFAATITARVPRTARGLSSSTAPPFDRGGTERSPVEPWRSRWPRPGRRRRRQRRVRGLRDESRGMNPLGAGRVALARAVAEDETESFRDRELAGGAKHDFGARCEVRDRLLHTVTAARRRWRPDRAHPSRIESTKLECARQSSRGSSSRRAV